MILAPSTNIIIVIIIVIIINKIISDIMNSLKSVVNWFRGQSDFSHTLMSAAATGAVSAVVTGLDQTHSTLVTLASSSVMLGTQ